MQTDTKKNPTQIPPETPPVTPPVTPPEPPPVDPPVTEDPTPEEIAALGDNMAESFFGVKPAKKNETTEPPAPPEDKPAEPAEPPPATAGGDKQPDPAPAPAVGLEEPPAEPVTKTATPAPVVNEDEIIDRVAERLAQKPAAEQPTEDPLAGFDPKDRRYLVVADHMAKTNPKYNGRDLTKEVTSFWQKEKDYIAKWERENPGETFTDSDPAHQQWYAKNQPAIEDEDFDEAKFDLRAKAIKEEARREAEQEIQRHLEPIRAKEEVARAQPVVQQKVLEAELSMVLEAAPAFKDLLENGQITKAAAEKMKAADPEAFEILAEQSAELKTVIKELQFKEELGPRYTFDPNKAVVVGDKTIYPHAEIRDTGIMLEQKIMEKPEAERVANGRQFITRYELSQTIQKINESKLTEDDKARRVDRLFATRWFIEPQDIRTALINKNARAAKRIIDLVNKRGPRPATVPASNAATPPAAPAAPKPASTTHTPPSTPGSVSDNVDTLKRAPNPDDERGKQIDSVMFGR